MRQQHNFATLIVFYRPIFCVIYMELSGAKKVKIIGLNATSEQY